MDTAPLPVVAPTHLQFKYVPRPGLLKITLINMVFNVLTLSFYRFWGKTNVRKHVWSCIHINNEPLEYTGTGIELFKGFMVVFGLFILPFVIGSTIAQIMLGAAHPVVQSLNGIFALGVYCFIGFAIYRARKYQLTRTLWRGIRGNLDGSAVTYSLTYFGSMIAKGVSLGWATPKMNTILQEQITGNMRFGDAAFKFRGSSKPLYPIYALCWFLTLVGIFVVLGVLGTQVAMFKNFEHLADNTDPYKLILQVALLLVVPIIVYVLVYPALWSAYAAKQMRTFANYTRFDGAQFRIQAGLGSIFWLGLGNLLILIFTLGIGWPFTTQRTFRYVIDRLTLEGAVDVARIQQSMLSMPKRGEGLADAFDVGAW